MLVYADEPVLAMGVNGGIAEYKDIVIPENAVDAEVWAMGIDAQTAYLEIVGKLGDAGVNPLVTLILGQLDVNQLLSGSVY